MIYGSSDSHEFLIVYWKTYMPPRHLLAIPHKDVESHKVTISDLAGSSPSSVIDLLVAHPISKAPSRSTILVAPFHSAQGLGAELPGCLIERDRVFPHLDLDHIAESMLEGWKDGLSLGIFDVDMACVEKAVSKDRKLIGQKAVAQPI
ncbi:hypothetical protein BN946_scf184978.g7 [Trametes cinnabarina]|uniref:Uncharacterized protein n=1 Tax=Pycnoporus cinnabarinus TaxID=5643 RepID=A0A060SWB7_PYCCI|nr:hypothetical protein BN946_scf184978.g7 [Trametes cinnabarina]